MCYQEFSKHALFQMQVLDEVQSYILLSRHIESGALVPFSADRAFLQAVSAFKLMLILSDLKKLRSDCIGRRVSF